MKDTRDQLVTLLTPIATTYYFYPQILLSYAESQQALPQNYFPMISYKDGHNADNFSDGTAKADMVEYTLDCWEREDNTGNLIEIHFSVDTAMIGAGYKRTMYVSQYETDAKIYHYTMKYQKPEIEI